MTAVTQAMDATTVVTMDMDWRWHRPNRRGDIPRGEPRPDERPVKCIAPNGRHTAPANNLPFADASVVLVETGHILAYVRNDEGLAQELRRIVRPTGSVRLNVPSTGPLEGIDAYNLHRYLVDITGRGLRPFETAENGWRRHFSDEDIRLLFPESAWEIVSHRCTGFAIEEVVRIAGFTAFRWLRPSRNWYRRVSAVANRIEAIERSLPISGTYWLEIELRRRAT
jgi:SAM-dependent methyltransferase